MTMPWQVSIILYIIYKKKDIIISASTGSGKSLLYQLIPLIKKGAIIFIDLPTIVLMTKQVCFPIITFYCWLLI